MFYRLFLLCFALTCLSLLILAKMRVSSFSVAMSLVAGSHVTTLCNSSAAVSLCWYAPNLTEVNDLTSVINGTGVYGYTFNGSITSAGVAYDTHNWCNMPHVRAQQYQVASSGYKLEYVELVREPIAFQPKYGC